MAIGKGKRKKKPPKRDNPAQSRKFIEAAKAMGVDEDGVTFSKVMDNLLKPKKGRGGK